MRKKIKIMHKTIYYSFYIKLSFILESHRCICCYILIYVFIETLISLYVYNLIIRPNNKLKVIKKYNGIKEAFFRDI